MTAQEVRHRRTSTPCPICGTLGGIGDGFCGKCGAELDAVAALLPLPGPPSSSWGDPGKRPLARVPPLSVRIVATVSQLLFLFVSYVLNLALGNSYFGALPLSTYCGEGSPAGLVSASRSTLFLTMLLLGAALATLLSAWRVSDRRPELAYGMNFLSFYLLDFAFLRLLGLPTGNRCWGLSAPGMLLATGLWISASYSLVSVLATTLVGLRAADPGRRPPAL